MTNRTDYPGIAALVDELRACGLASGARITLTEGGRTFRWTEPRQCPACKGPMRKHATLEVFYCRNPECVEFDRATVTRAARVAPERAGSLPPLPPSPITGPDKGSEWNTSPSRIGKNSSTIKREIRLG